MMLLLFLTRLRNRTFFFCFFLVVTDTLDENSMVRSPNTLKATQDQNRRCLPSVTWVSVEDKSNEGTFSKLYLQVVVRLLFT